MVISKHSGLPVASEAPGAEGRCCPGPPGHAGMAPWSRELVAASALSAASLQAPQLPGILCVWVRKPLGLWKPQTVSEMKSLLSGVLRAGMLFITTAFYHEPGNLEALPTDDLIL